MNTRRVAHLLRELADELDPPAASAPASPSRKPKAKRVAVRKAYVPQNAPSDLDVARARAAGRRLGILPS